MKSNFQNILLYSFLNAVSIIILDAQMMGLPAYSLREP